MTTTVNGIRKHFLPCLMMVTTLPALAAPADLSSAGSTNISTVGSTLPALAAPTDLPTGGAVVAGSASISTAGSAMTVATSSTRSVITWNSFSIGNAAQVNFNQPNANSAVLNRVTGSDISQISGALNSNGSVFLVNPNGVVIGMGAQFSLPAITINTSTDTPGNADFMNGLDSGFFTVSNAWGGDFVLDGTLTATNSINLAIAGTPTLNGIISATNVTINCLTCASSGPIGGLPGGDMSIIGVGPNWAGGNFVIQPGSTSGLTNWNNINIGQSVIVSGISSVGGLVGHSASGSVPAQNVPGFAGGQVSLISSSGISIPSSTSTPNVLTLSGQSLQLGGGAPVVSLSPSSAQAMADLGQINVVGGQVQITSQGAADVMSSLVNSGGLSNATSMTVSGNTVVIGL